MREVGYGLSLEGASSADLMKCMPRLNLALGKENPLDRSEDPIGAVPGCSDRTTGNSEVGPGKSDKLIRTAAACNI